MDDHRSDNLQYRYILSTNDFFDDLNHQLFNYKLKNR